MNPILRLAMPGVISSVPYSSILINTYGASEVWPLVDIASGTTITAKVNTARNGTLAGWDLQNAAGPVPGTLAPFSDGTTTDSGNIFTTSLAGIFNGNVGSVFAWYRVANAGVWTDSTNRLGFVAQVNSTNLVRLLRDVASNTLRLERRGGGTVAVTDTSIGGSTAWFSLGLSWDTGGSAELKAFINGSQVGSTATGIGTFTGTIVSAVIGASTTLTANWHGWLAYTAVRFGSIWTPTQFANMHNAAASAGAG